jgi:hypothetical protein
MACCDKITCCEKKIKFFLFTTCHEKNFKMLFCFVLVYNFVTIRHDGHVYKLHLYKIH